MRHLNENNVPTGKRSRISTEFGTLSNPTWNKTRINRILVQQKYIAIWRYGESICRKDENGKFGGEGLVARQFPGELQG
jgi:hypothetical protein